MTASGKLPAGLMGGWSRRSLRVQGEPEDTSPAVWLQADAEFADLRAPANATIEDVTAFAGWVAWEPHAVADGGATSVAGAMTWHHALDLHPWVGDDAATLELDGDDLHETGTWIVAGRPVPYVEHWTRLASSGGGRLVMRPVGVDGCLVRTGRHAITMVDRRPAGGDLSAAYRVLVADGMWQLRATCGADAGTLLVPPTIGTLEPAVGTDGLTWRTIATS